MNEDVGKSDLQELGTSPLVRKFGRDIVLAARGRPIIDVACGGGRNSVWISHLGGQVVGIDIDLSRIQNEAIRSTDSPFAEAFSRVGTLRLDLIEEAWPYLPGSIGGIINTHFLHQPLLRTFSQSLIVGGLLILETVEGRGGNYLQLPAEGDLRMALQESFRLLFYRERRVGPQGSSAVTVKLVGAKL